MGQHTLFDEWGLAEGKSRKDEGMSRVTSHQPLEWLECMDLCSIEIAKRHQYFSMDDIRREMYRAFPGVRPTHNNAWGGYAKRLKTLGVAIPTDRTTPGQRVARKAGKQTIWRSNLR